MGKVSWYLQALLSLRFIPLVCIFMPLSKLLEITTMVRDFVYYDILSKFLQTEDSHNERVKRVMVRMNVSV